MNNEYCSKCKVTWDTDYQSHECPAESPATTKKVVGLGYFAGSLDTMTKEEHIEKLRKLQYEVPIEAYQPEIWAVPKDTIYAATTALQLALGYMPMIKTDVPQWAKTLELDIQRMQTALEELRKLDCFLGSEVNGKSC